MQSINTAVIGFGLSAKVFHLPFIQASAQFSLRAISSSQTEAVRQQYPDVMCFNDAETLIAQAQAELVVITAPNQAHFSLAKQALEQGKHVLIEKPVTITSEECRQLIELAKRQRKLLAPFHNRRWDGDFLTIMHLIEQNTLGQIKFFESHFDRFRPEPQQRWRENKEAGSGILYDLGPHLIDQALALFGLPQAVTARVLKLRPQAQAVDYFHLQLHYADKEVILHADPYQAGPNPRFKLQGTKGSYIKYGLDPQEDRLRRGITPTEVNWAAETPEQYGTLYHANDSNQIPTLTGGYQHLYHHLADCINNHLAFTVSTEDALNGIRLIELALQSQDVGGTVSVDNK
ncbi:oxidoreductase [Bowmanella denitrificans]|uniref:oxidoreductase n=1 Tax=Bowmanella denitrificans TaxID=366582 RepID=UPI000C9A764F|nr:oxidoreductase [Bowmanella denitrificans]